MATADCTTTTHDEGEFWEEGLHSLSCSEDEDRGELVCTGLNKAHCCFSMWYNISCCLDHEKGPSRNFIPIHAEMQSCADTEWNMSIMGWVWLLVPLRGCGYHRNGEEKGKGSDGRRTGSFPIEHI